MTKFFQKTTLLPFPMKIFLIIRQLKVVVFHCLHPANYAPRNLKSWHSVLFNKEKGKLFTNKLFPKENNTGNMDVGESGNNLREF